MGKTIIALILVATVILIGIALISILAQTPMPIG